MHVSKTWGSAPRLKLLTGAGARRSRAAARCGGPRRSAPLPGHGSCHGRSVMMRSADARPSGHRASDSRTACLTCVDAERLRSPWPSNRIHPGSVTRRNAGLRAGTQPQTRRRRVKLWPDGGGAPGSPGS